MLQLIALALIASGQGPDSQVAMMRASELLLKGDVARLVSDTRSTDLATQHYAIWALGQTGDSRHVPLLTELSQQPETREEAIRSLYFLGMPAYRILLKEAISGPRPGRSHAASLLSAVVANTHRPVPVEAKALLWELRVSDDPKLRYRALTAALWIEGIPATIEQVEPFLDDSDPVNRQIAIGFMALRTREPEILRKVLHMAVNDRHAGVRAYILSNFGWMGGYGTTPLAKEQFDAVMRALLDEPKAAKYALEIVKNVNGPIGRSTARNLVATSAEEAARIKSVQKLWDSDALRNRVRKWLKNNDPEIRLRAILALAALQSPDAFDKLIAWNMSFEDEAWERGQILQAIGWTGDSRALPYLEKRLPEANAEERLFILKAFAQLGSLQHLDLITEFILDKSANPDQRSSLGREVYRYDTNYANAIFSLVMDPVESKRVRGNLLSVLPEKSKTRAYDVAIAVLRRPEDEQMHWQAVIVLERIGDPRAIPDIERVAEGAEGILKRVAERALKKLRGL
ncbi:MAG: HEAT repeat domain-containing protein [Armatimonadota bacterium]|nr:HEAT repeat domain-containing protein [Armatimonadota bacterium]